MKSATGDMVVVYLLATIAGFPFWVSIIYGLIVYIAALLMDNKKS